LDPLATLTSWGIFDEEINETKRLLAKKCDKRYLCQQSMSLGLLHIEKYKLLKHLTQKKIEFDC